MTAWVVVFDDNCPDPARYVAGVFTAKGLAEEYVTAKCERAARATRWDWEVVECEIDPVATDNDIQP